MSKIVTDGNKCTKEMPLCFNKPIGKKPIIKTCYGETYTPLKMLKFMLSDASKIPNKKPVKNCGNLCSCKEYDLAWFTLISDIVIRLEKIIINLNNTNKDELTKNIRGIFRKNNNALNLSSILQKIKEVGKKKWEIKNINNIKEKRILEFFHGLDKIEKSYFIKSLDKIMSNKIKINHDMKNINSEDIKKATECINSLINLFNVLKYLGYNKNHFDEKASREIQESLNKIMNIETTIKQSLNNKKSKKVKKVIVNRSKKGGSSPHMAMPITLGPVSGIIFIALYLTAFSLHVVFSIIKYPFISVAKIANSRQQKKWNKLTQKRQKIFQQVENKIENLNTSIENINLYLSDYYIKPGNQDKSKIIKEFEILHPKIIEIKNFISKNNSPKYPNIPEIYEIYEQLAVKADALSNKIEELKSKSIWNSVTK